MTKIALLTVSIDKLCHFSTPNSPLISLNDINNLFRTKKRKIWRFVQRTPKKPLHTLTNCLYKYFQDVILNKVKDLKVLSQ